jgi:type IV secretion system protein TrbJ
MKPCNRRPILGAGLSLGIFLAAAGPASAQLAVVCGNCADIGTQLLSYAKEAQSMATQIEQYQTQLQQYANMVTNTVALPEEAWSTVQSDILQVQNMSNAASLLSGNSGSLISRLQSASSYANQVGTLGNIPSQITDYQQTIGNNPSALGKTLGIQQGQEKSDTALLTSLQQHSQSAAGQMQAIQAGNELAHQQATQLMEIQATLSATAQMEATQMAVGADRRASEDAELAHFNSPPPVVTSGYQQW